MRCVADTTAPRGPCVLKFGLCHVYLMADLAFLVLYVFFEDLSIVTQLSSTLTCCSAPSDCGYLSYHITHHCLVCALVSSEWWFPTIYHTGMAPAICSNQSYVENAPLQKCVKLCLIQQFF